MDKFKTIAVGGLPHTLNDFRQFLGRLDVPSEGIYQAFNNILGGFGTDFIVQGCILSGSAGSFSITEGWILLSGELIKVDAQGPFDETVNGTFTKVTTFDSRGTKTFLNGSVNETYEKNRGVLSGLAGTLDFDGKRVDPIFDAWVTEVFDAGDYTAGIGSWTVVTGKLRSKVIGKTMIVNISVSSSNTSGDASNNVLNVKIPQGKTISEPFSFLGKMQFSSGDPFVVQFDSKISTNEISITRFDTAIGIQSFLATFATITFEID